MNFPESIRGSLRLLIAALFRSRLHDVELRNDSAVCARLLHADVDNVIEFSCSTT